MAAIPSSSHVQNENYTLPNERSTLSDQEIQSTRNDIYTLSNLEKFRKYHI